MRYANVIACLNSDYEDIVGLLIERTIDMKELHEALEDIAPFAKRRIDVVIKNILENSHDSERDY